MTKEKITKVTEYLNNNLDVAVNVAREINSWDGSFPEFDSVELEEFVSWYIGDDASKLVEIILNSLDNLSSNTEMIRATDFNEIEEITEEDLENEVVDYIDEIVDKLDELYPHSVSVWDSDLEELLNEDEEEDEEINNEYLEESIKNKVDFKTYCDNGNCDTCPFNKELSAIEQCEKAYNMMLNSHNLEEAIVNAK